jgi:hypothetical protein
MRLVAAVPPEFITSRQTRTPPGQVIHERERPHACPASGCWKAFGQRQDLLGHLRAVHQGERHHRCEEPGCGKVFAFRDGVRQHRMAAHR